MPSLDTRGLVPGLPASVEAKRMPLSRCRGLPALLGLDGGVGPKAVGLSWRLTKKGAIEAVALATETLVVQITIDSAAGPSGTAVEGDSNGLSDTLLHPSCILVGMDMTRAALLLAEQFGVDCEAVDLPPLFPEPKKPGLLPPGALARQILHEKASEFRINKLWYYESNDDLRLRAWLSTCIAARRLGVVQRAAKLCTENLSDAHLECLATLAMNTELLQAAKPTRSENEFSGIGVEKGGELILHNARFQNRVRKSRQTYVQIDGTARARPVAAVGKVTGLWVFHGKVGREVQKVWVMGREEATCPETSRDKFIARILQGRAVLDHSPYVRLLWFPKDKPEPKQKMKATNDETFSTLNPSQRTVAAAMIAEDGPLVIAHGPPGTGKTTTIAAALKYFQEHKQPVWVIAQSNVGVKNVARSIIDKGIKFKLLVSQEFYYEWHEHLYKEGVEDTLIQTSMLFGEDFDPELDIGDAQIILCTLAMLSNPLLHSRGVYKYRPVEHLVVDEASQIDAYEFLHLFNMFDKLRKMCVFGDPKQLPPYGKETAPKMRTIFDFEHIQRHAYLLDTQYRMPVLLGAFISKTMYRSLLKSVHLETGRACIRFVDVRKGEEESVGCSWKNTEEGHTVVNLVKNYYLRHRDKFCIITPYDAQRDTITKLLKAAKLPSDIVYNVDSYQGHEAPYVIVSAVRTTKPGFLSFRNRMNVMLSRCKAGMVVVTQRAFVAGKGRDTLLAGLVRDWEAAAADVWVDAMEVADGRANMPGSPGKGGAVVGGTKGGVSGAGAVQSQGSAKGGPASGGAGASGNGAAGNKGGGGGKNVKRDKGAVGSSPKPGNGAKANGGKQAGTKKQESEVQAGAKHSGGKRPAKAPKK